MYSGRIIFKVLAKLKQFNLAILPASNHRNIPYIPNSLYSLFGKTYPFDILLTEKRSACFVASAPFEVPVIQFRIGFGSRYVFFRLISLLQKMGKSRGKLLYAQYAPFNPTRNTRQWTAVARRPDCPPLGLPPDPQRPGRNRTAPPPSPWPSPRGQGPGG